MLQTCGWKPEKLSKARLEISRRAERLPRYVRGAVSPFSYFRFSQDLHPELARQLRASAVWVWDVIFVFPITDINKLKIEGL
jgi:hypothetical protein